MIQWQQRWRIQGEEDQQDSPLLFFVLVSGTTPLLEMFLSHLLTFISARRLDVVKVTTKRSSGWERFEPKSIAWGYGRVRVFTSPARSCTWISLLLFLFSCLSICFRWLFLLIYISKQNNWVIGSPAIASPTFLWFTISTRREHLSCYYWILIGVRGQDVDVEFAWEAVSK